MLSDIKAIMIQVAVNIKILGNSKGWDVSGYVIDMYKTLKKMVHGVLETTNAAK